MYRKLTLNQRVSKLERLLKENEDHIELVSVKERPFDYGTQEFINITLHNKIIGQINLLKYDTGELHIDRIDIDDDYQNKGYGTEALSKFSGAYIVPDNKRAAELYSRIGTEVRPTDDFSSLDEGYGVFIID